MRWDGT
jgi:hypothetical protein